MYFLPFDARTRFVAFKDEPLVVEELAEWLSAGRTWEELPLNSFLTSKIVDGTAILGVFFKRDKTFITNSVGHPQISFENNPQSLLFAFGNYKIVGSSDSFSYDNLNTEFVRQQISYHSYAGEEENLEEVWEEIEDLKASKVGIVEFITTQNLLTKARNDITRLSQRNDPLTVMMPVIAAEASVRDAAIKDILQRMDELELANSTGIIDLTNIPTKTELYDQLSKKTAKSYVDGVAATKASETALLNHIFDTNVHNPTPAKIGSPSLADFNTLLERVTSAENRLSILELLDPLRTVQTVGGILATKQANGVLRIDSSGVGIGTGDKPQEVSWYRDGILALEEGTGHWRAWEDATIIGVSTNVNIPSVGAPIILDIKNNGVSVYTTTSNRPTIPEGVYSIVAPLPDNVVINQGDKLTADIVNVGTLLAGSDLTIQVRYQYT